MKTLLIKIFTITLAAAFICKRSAEAQVLNPQSKIKDCKFKNNPLLHIKQNQSAKNSGQNFGLKINPFWQDVNAPHLVNNSHVREVKIPSFNTIWASVDYDTAAYVANSFFRSTDGGKRWRLDSVDAPYGYGISGIAPIDAKTCYAAMFNAFPIGGGVFKTTDGGDTWKQLEPGKLFGGENSFPDIIYFFDAQHGVTIGDDDQIDSSRLEIYTTSDAGKTWQRVPDQNIPPTQGYAFSSNFNSFTVFQNRLWVTAGDTYGNNYIYRSDDFGHHWQQFPYTLTTPIYDFAFADRQNGLGVSFDDAPHVVATHDGGKTWADKSFTGYLMPLCITTIPFTHTFVSTISSGFTTISGSSYSNDYGATWKLIDSSSAFSSFAVAFLNPLIGWAGRADSPDPNGGMYKWKYQFTLDNNSLATTDNNEDISSVTKNIISNAALSLYPNPAKDIIKVQGLSLPAETTLSLFNASGKLLQHSITTGESYTYNIQNLPAGNYYIKVQTAGKNTTLQFVKQ